MTTFFPSAAGLTWRWNYIIKYVGLLCGYIELSCVYIYIHTHAHAYRRLMSSGRSPYCGNRLRRLRICTRLANAKMMLVDNNKSSHALNMRVKEAAAQ